MVTEHTKLLRPKLAALLQSDPTIFHEDDDDNNNNYSSSKSSSPSSTSPRYNYNSAISPSGDTSPYLLLSPSNHPYSPYMKSPWIIPSPISYKLTNNGLIGSISREGGHVYSLAAAGDLLYTGSDSKNIRVWKNCKEFSGFKSNSGLVKAIVLHGNKIFTGHQDGKIRVWRVSARNPAIYKRVGTLPTLKDSVTSSVNPKNYVKVRRHRNVLRIKHFDAVSCLSLNEETGLLYSCSWDKTMKVWRISDFKCLESINAHDDAINSVVSGFDSFVLTGSADGSVKMWRRELVGSGTKHFLVQTLLKQENAVTALAVNQESAVIYCGSSDGLVNFWERENYLSHSGVLRGHKSAVLCLASAGNLVFSGSADKTICVWRREAGGVHICLSVLTGHGGPVKCLAVEEDHENDSDEGDHDQRWIVYSGSLDRSVKIWRVAEQPLEVRDYESPRVSYSSSPIRPQKNRRDSRVS